MIRAAEMVAHPPLSRTDDTPSSRWGSDTSCAVSPMGRRGSPHLALRNGRRSCGYQSSGRRRLVAARPDIEPDVAVTQTPRQKPRPRLTAWAKQSGHPLWVQKPVRRFPDDGIANTVLYPHGGDPNLLVLRTSLCRGMTGTFCPNRRACRVDAPWGEKAHGPDVLLAPVFGALGIVDGGLLLADSSVVEG